MSTKSNKAAVHYFHDVFNTGDLYIVCEHG
jgi:hypothetical protein